MWLVSEPPAYQSSEGQHVELAARYQYQPDPGCNPYEIGQLSTAAERAAQARGCANQGEDHRREIDDLTQQTRAAEGVERGNWLAEANFLLSRLQLVLSALGAAALIYSLYLNRMALTTAEAAVAVTRDMAIAEARAYLHVANAEVFFLARGPLFPGHGSGDLFGIRLTVENTGNTPAKWYQVEGTCEFSVADSENTTTVEVIPIKPQRWDMLAPHSETSSPVNDPEIRILFIKAGETNGGLVEFKGKLSYRTEFDETRIVPFHFFAKGKKLHERMGMSLTEARENKKVPISMQRPNLPLMD